MIIISKTPLRISFSGGGTDIKDFFQNEYGCVISSTINKYIYIAIHKYYDENVIFLKYSKSEHVTNYDDINHPLFREALKLTGVKGVEITSFADIPSTGSGLASSSAFLVGLLNVLFAYKGIRKSLKELAEHACNIERNILQEEGGYQDQYACAYGGLNYIIFNEDYSINVNPVVMSKSSKDALNSKLLLFYTGISRKSTDVLLEQKKNSKNNFHSLKELKKLTLNLKNEIEKGNIMELGITLKKGWELKRNFAAAISNDQINKIYEKGIKAGAIGGKLLGAGGGGYILFYCDEDKQDNLRKTLSDLKEFKFSLEPDGSRIIYYSD